MMKAKSGSNQEHETKYVFENRVAPMLIRWLQLRCLPDPQFAHGMVSSIYYDTRDWRFLKEKFNSDYLKTKIRVRWYAEIDGGEQGNQSFLEAKYKIGGRRKKIRLNTDFTGKWLSEIDLYDSELLNIPMMLWSLGVKIPSSLYPVFQISYRRFRFLDPVSRCRLCIDYDIGIPRVNWQMLPKVNPIQLQKGVFELKGTIFELPDGLQQLIAFGCRKQSFSKYSICYEKLMQNCDV